MHHTGCFDLEISHISFSIMQQCRKHVVIRRFFLRKQSTEKMHFTCKTCTRTQKQDDPPFLFLYSDLPYRANMSKNYYYNHEADICKAKRPPQCTTSHSGCSLGLLSEGAFRDHSHQDTEVGWSWTSYKHIAGIFVCCFLSSTFLSKTREEPPHRHRGPVRVRCVLGGTWHVILGWWDSCWQSRFTVFSPFGFNSSSQADRYSIPSPPPQLHLLWYCAGPKTPAVKEHPLKCNTTLKERALHFKIFQGGGGGGEQTSDEGGRKESVTQIIGL